MIDVRQVSSLQHYYFPKITLDFMFFDPIGFKAICGPLFDILCILCILCQVPIWKWNSFYYSCYLLLPHCRDFRSGVGGVAVKGG